MNKKKQDKKGLAIPKAFGKVTEIKTNALVLDRIKG